MDVKLLQVKQMVFKVSAAALLTLSLVSCVGVDPNFFSNQSFGEEISLQATTLSTVLEVTRSCSDKGMGDLYIRSEHWDEFKKVDDVPGVTLTHNCVVVPEEESAAANGQWVLSFSLNQMGYGSIPDNQVLIFPLFEAHGKEELNKLQVEVDYRTPQLTVPFQTVNEDDGSIKFNFQLDSEPTEMVTFNVELKFDPSGDSELSALLAASGDDPVETGDIGGAGDVHGSLHTISFPPGEKNAELTFSVNNDSTYELDEVFYLTNDDITPETHNIRTLNDVPLRVQGKVRNDSDPKPQIWFVTTAESQVEGTNMSFSIGSSGASEVPFKVNYKVVAHGIESIDEFNSATGMVADFTINLNEEHLLGLFSVGDTINLPLTAESDERYEKDETFRVILASSLHVDLHSSNSTEAIGTITNDDMVNLEFASASVSMTEGSESEVVLSLSQTSGVIEDEIVVTYNVTDGTAVAGEDYTSGPSMTQSFFMSDNNNLSLSIPIVDDDIFEGSESFDITLSAASGVTIGSVSAINVNIMENDSPPVVNVGGASGELYFLAESAANLPIDFSAHKTRFDAEFKIKLKAYDNPGDPEASSITVDSSDFLPAANYGTAVLKTFTDGSDLDLKIGDSPNQFHVMSHFNLDDIFEGDEKFIVEFSDPMNVVFGCARGVLSNGGNTCSYTVTITDNDTPSLVLHTSSVMEGAMAPVGFTIDKQLKNPMDLTVAFGAGTTSSLLNVGRLRLIGATTPSFQAGIAGSQTIGPFYFQVESNGDVERDSGGGEVTSPQVQLQVSGDSSMAVATAHVAVYDDVSHIEATELEFMGVILGEGVFKKDSPNHFVKFPLMFPGRSGSANLQVKYEVSSSSESFFVNPSMPVTSSPILETIVSYDNAEIVHEIQSNSYGEKYSIKILSVYDAVGSSYLPIRKRVSSANIPMYEYIPKMSLGVRHSCFSTEDGDVRCRGKNHFRSPGYPTTTSWEPHLMPDSVTSSAFGVYSRSLSANLPFVDSTQTSLSLPSQFDLFSNNTYDELKNTDQVLSYYSTGQSFEMGTSVSSPTPLTEPARDYPFNCLVGEFQSGNGNEVVCWGRNDYYQSGNNLLYGSSGNESSTIDSNVNEINVDYSKRVMWYDGSPHSLNHVISYTAGAAHACALDKEGQVFCWGSNVKKQLKSSAPSEKAMRARQIELDAKAIAIEAGGWSTCALLINQKVQCWGDNRWGQLGDGTTTSSYDPVYVMQSSSPANVYLSRVTKIAVGQGHACAVQQGYGSSADVFQIFCWGNNVLQQFGISGSNTNSNIAMKLPLYNRRDGSSYLPVAASFDRVYKLDAGVNHMCAHVQHTVSGTDKNALICWGSQYDGGGQLGVGAYSHFKVANLIFRPGIPTEIKVTKYGADGLDIIDFKLGGYHGCVVANNVSHTGPIMPRADVFCWGQGDNNVFHDYYNGSFDHDNDAITAGIEFYSIIPNFGSVRADGPMVDGEALHNGSQIENKTGYMEGLHN